MNNLKIKKIFQKRSETAFSKIIQWSFDTDFNFLPLNFNISGSKFKENINKKDYFMENLKDLSVSINNVSKEDKIIIDNYIKYFDHLEKDFKENSDILFSEFIRFKKIREFGEYTLNEEDCLKFLGLDSRKLYKNKVYISLDIRTNYNYFINIFSKENADHEVYITIPIMNKDTYSGLMSISQGRELNYQKDKHISKIKERLNNVKNYIELAIDTKNIYYSVTGQYDSLSNQFKINSSF